MLFSILAYFGFGALADFAWLGGWEHTFMSRPGMESHFDAMSQEGSIPEIITTWMALCIVVSRFVLALRRERLIREGTSL